MCSKWPLLHTTILLLSECVVVVVVVRILLLSKVECCDKFCCGAKFVVVVGSNVGAINTDVVLSSTISTVDSTTTFVGCPPPSMIVKSASALALCGGLGLFV